MSLTRAERLVTADYLDSLGEEQWERTIYLLRHWHQHPVPRMPWRSFGAEWRASMHRIRLAFHNDPVIGKMAKKCAPAHCKKEPEARYWLAARISAILSIPVMVTFHDGPILLRKGDMYLDAYSHDWSAVFDRILVQAPFGTHGQAESIARIIRNQIDSRNGLTADNNRGRRVHGIRRILNEGVSWEGALTGIMNREVKLTTDPKRGVLSAKMPVGTQLHPLETALGVDSTEEDTKRLEPEHWIQNMAVRLENADICYRQRHGALTTEFQPMMEI